MNGKAGYRVHIGKKPYLQGKEQKTLRLTVDFEPKSWAFLRRVYDRGSFRLAGEITYDDSNEDTAPHLKSIRTYREDSGKRQNFSFIDVTHFEFVEIAKDEFSP